MADAAYECVTLGSTSPAVPLDAVRPGKAIPVSAHFFRASARQSALPAVVLSQSFLGVSEPAKLPLAMALARAGVATLAIDSASHRSRTRFMGLGVSDSTRLADAFAGLCWLAARDGIDGARIAHVGVGAGGEAAVLSAYGQLAALFCSDGLRFHRHIAVATPMTTRLVDPRTTAAPVYLLAAAPTLQPGESARLDLVAGDLALGGSAVEVATLPADAGLAAAAMGEGHHPKFQIRPDGVLVDERTGMVVGGALSRMLAVARATGGFSFQRSPPMVVSDATLDFILHRVL